MKEDYKEYIRTTVTEMAEWHEDFNMDRVAIHPEEVKNGAPQIGDMIARNPKNHDDKWLVGKEYFKNNFALKNLEVNMAAIPDGFDKEKFVANWNATKPLFVIPNGLNFHHIVYSNINLVVLDDVMKFIIESVPVISVTGNTVVLRCSIPFKNSLIDSLLSDNVVDIHTEDLNKSFRYKDNTFKLEITKYSDKELASVVYENIHIAISKK